MVIVYKIIIVNDAIPQPNHTHNVENTSCTITNSLSVAGLILINYGHHTHCLSLTQVTPGHVSEIVAMDMEGVKPENPELKKYYKYIFFL